MNRITNELKTRLIVIKGWGLNNTLELQNNPDIKIVDDAPYDKLMPHIKAVIHHGGIVAVAECLRAGKPFLSCPVLYSLGDQYFWGKIAYGKKLALKPIPLKKITEDKLIASIKELLTNEKLYVNCNKIMEELRTENGVENAIHLIEHMEHK